MIHELSIYNFIKIDAIKNLASNTEDKYQNYIALRYAHNKKARLISFYMIIGGIILISAAKLIEIGNSGWNTKFIGRFFISWLSLVGAMLNFICWILRINFVT